MEITGQENRAYLTDEPAPPVPWPFNGRALSNHNDRFIPPAEIIVTRVTTITIKTGYCVCVGRDF